MSSTRMARSLIGIAFLAVGAAGDAWSQWPNRFETSTNFYNTVEITETVVDDQGFVYSTGFFEGTVDFAPDSGTDAFVRTTTDCPRESPSAGACDVAFVTKVGPDGAIEWVWTLPLEPTSLPAQRENQIGNGLSVESGADPAVYVTGNRTIEQHCSPCDPDSDKLFVAKIDANGQTSWISELRKHPGVGADSQYANALVDAAYGKSIAIAERTVTGSQTTEQMIFVLAEISGWVDFYDANDLVTRASVGVTDKSFCRNGFYFQNEGSNKFQRDAVLAAIDPDTGEWKQAVGHGVTGAGGDTDANRVVALPGKDGNFRTVVSGRASLLNQVFLWRRPARQILLPTLAGPTSFVAWHTYDGSAFTGCGDGMGVEALQYYRVLTSAGGRNGPILDGLSAESVQLPLATEEPKVWVSGLFSFMATVESKRAWPNEQTNFTEIWNPRTDASSDDSGFFLSQLRLNSSGEPVVSWTEGSDHTGLAQNVDTRFETAIAHDADGNVYLAVDLPRDTALRLGRDSLTPVEFSAVGNDPTSDHLVVARYAAGDNSTQLEWTQTAVGTSGHSRVPPVSISIFEPLVSLADLPQIYVSTGISAGTLSTLTLGARVEPPAIGFSDSVVALLEQSEPVAAPGTFAGNWVIFEDWILGQSIPNPDGTVGAPYLSIANQPAPLADYFLVNTFGNPAITSVVPLDFTSGTLIWGDNPDPSSAGAPSPQQVFTRSRGTVVPPDDSDVLAHFPDAPLDFDPGASDLTFQYLFDGSPLSSSFFTGSDSGYTVVVYTVGAGSGLDDAEVRTLVVRTRPPSDGDADPRWAIANSPDQCVIGQEVVEPLPGDGTDRTGFVVNSRARFDGLGPFRAQSAYDRNTRQGRIIPVNRADPNDPETDMTVSWYAPTTVDVDGATGTTSLAILQPTPPQRYDCQWPQAESVGGLFLFPAADENLQISAESGTSTVVQLVAGGNVWLDLADTNIQLELVVRNSTGVLLERSVTSASFGYPQAGEVRVTLPGPEVLTFPDTPDDRAGVTVAIRGDQHWGMLVVEKQADIFGTSSSVEFYTIVDPLPGRIVIDNQEGSDYDWGFQPVVDPDIFLSPRVYWQNDVNLPGYNPNDEHAFLTDANPDPEKGRGKQSVFALRASDDAPSDPYTLLKYFEDPDPAQQNEAGEGWAFLVYEVVENELFADSQAFVFGGTAGDPLPLPYPLNEIPACVDFDPDNDVVGRGYYVDHTGLPWASAASDPGSTTRVFYRYDTIPAFLDAPGDPGGCFGWPSKRPKTVQCEFPTRENLEDDSLCERPIQFALEWPASSPLLTVGDTLRDARGGLPDVAGEDAISIAYDDGDPNGDDPLSGLVRLYDPLTPRAVPLAQVSLAAIPAEDQKLVAGTPRIRFARLPATLAARVEYDPLTETLTLSGSETPMLLANVLNARERDLLKALASDGHPGEAAWDAAIDQLYAQSRDPNGVNPGGLGIGVESDPDGGVRSARLETEPKALSALTTSADGYVTLALNDSNSPGVEGEVDLRVIRVQCAANGGPARGAVQAIPAESLFAKETTLRLSGDFAGEPERFDFQWWIHPDVDGRSPAPPEPGDEGLWERLQAQDFGFTQENLAGTPGANEITIVPGADPVRILADHWFFTRYLDRDPVAGSSCSEFSTFAGDPRALESDPLAMLGEGWIKRTLTEVTPFQQRIDDFHDTPVDTFASLLTQAGDRFDGPVALQNDTDEGLIRIYQTLLEDGIDLSVDQGLDFGPVNNSLLFATTRIADLYMLLGNEAFADALDPTIGFDTASGEVGSQATSLFAFANQLPSLLKEELALLRGRDSTSAGVAESPFNRLLWNFSTAEGEIAYRQTYGIGNLNGDAESNIEDAKIAFPQGHGDAWGHYLTATKAYYRLLQEPSFSWEARAESVVVDGSALLVDFVDERKFARAAAAKARVGAEIVDLTYRDAYVEDPAGQWQGYKDTDAERAWGVDGSARRAGQAAYFDWAVANSILPAADPNPTHQDVRKIDRTTVPELEEIVSSYRAVEMQLDEADRGLNPLGLAKGVVPFDIDPSLLAVGADAQTHFEQIYERAEAALQNAVRVFDHANAQSRRLRENQDSQEDFAADVAEQEADFRNRMIEVFGTPYLEDIGPAGTYPTGYNGPDLYSFLVIDPSPLTGERSALTEEIEAFYNCGEGGLYAGFADSLPVGADPRINACQGNQATILNVTYEVTTDGTGLVVKPGNWTGREAQGEIQRRISDFLQMRARYEQATDAYERHVGRIVAARDRLELQFDLNADEIRILRDQRERVESLNEAIVRLETGALGLRRYISILSDISEATTSGFPRVTGFSNDFTSGIRGAIQANLVPISEIAFAAADALQIRSLEFEQRKQDEALSTGIEIAQLGNDAEIRERLRELEALIREEAGIRLETFVLQEQVKQAQTQYLSAIARGSRLMDEVEAFRRRVAARTEDARYRDITFRTFRDDSLAKYRSTFDLAARYAYLAATAYDYETNLLGSSGAGREFLADIVKQRSLGQLLDGVPVVGSNGLADPMARLTANFNVLKGQLGFNNPQVETNRFSLRSELLRIRASDPRSDADWRTALARFRVDDLWDIPEFRRYCRSFAPEFLGNQPGLVIPFDTTVTFGQNFFGWPLGPGDSAYDASRFATKVRSVGVWFDDYDIDQLSNTPRVYLVPAGMDVLRSPEANNFAIREWQVVDQALPVPFPIGASDLNDPDWVPVNDTLSAPLAEIRRIASFRAHKDQGFFDASETISDSRLVGRSVWNTRWLLIIPGGTLLFDPDEALDTFVSGAPVPGGDGERDGNGVSDIQIFFQTYSYPGF